MFRLIIQSVSPLNDQLLCVVQDEKHSKNKEEYSKLTATGHRTKPSALICHLLFLMAVSDEPGRSRRRFSFHLSA